MVVMLKTWAHKLANARLTLHIDNIGVCKNDDIMELIRELFSILFTNNMECHCIYIESSCNVVTDALSRWDFHTFKRVKPESSIRVTLPAKVEFYDQLI